MKDSIEKKCIDKDVKLTDQRKIIAKVMSESNILNYDYIGDSFSIGFNKSVQFNK